MIDKIIKELEDGATVIPLEQWREWQRSPITQDLMRYLLAKYLELTQNQPPDDVQAAALYAHRMAAVLALTEEINAWEPAKLLKDEETEE